MSLDGGEGRGGEGGGRDGEGGEGGREGEGGKSTFDCVTPNKGTLLRST